MEPQVQRIDTNHPELSTRTGPLPKWAHADFAGVEKWAQRTSREMVRRAQNMDMQDAARMDINEGYFFAPDLTEELAQVFDKKWPLLKARGMVTVQPIKRGVREVGYRGYDHAGLARMKGPHATDMPFVTASGARLTAPVRTNWIGEMYDIFDLEAASVANGTPLDQALMVACRRGCETRFDLQLRFGDAGTAITGLCNNAAAETIALTNGSWDNAGTTVQQILDDHEQVFTKMAADSMGAHGVTRVAYESDAWNRISAPNFGVEGSGRSILQILREKHPEITFELWYALDTSAGAGASQDTGLGGIPQVIWWEDSDEILWSGVQREASPEAPQQNLADFIVMWLQSVIPGVVVTYPVGLKYTTNQHT